MTNVKKNRNKVRVVKMSLVLKNSNISVAMENKDIENIIIKYFNKSIDQKEREILSKWIADPKNYAVFESYVKTHYEITLGINSPNTTAIKERLLREMRPEKEQRTRVLRPIFKYAVAATVALLVSIAFLMNKDRTDTQEVIVVNSIKAGTDKATLTLEDGTDIALEKGKKYVANNLSSNGEEIVYNALPNSKQDAVYNYLTIPRGGQYFVKLSDGTQVWLNSESKLKYPVQFVEGKTRQVELIYGEAFFDVSPSTNHKGAKFKVRTRENQNIEVLGTAFNVKAYKDETKIYTTLVEGKVLVDNNVSKETLKPGEQTIFNTLNNDLDVNEADVYSETSWIKGDFVFNKKPLKDIMKVLSRWYDVDVVFENKTLETSRFNGELSKYQNLEEILILIKTTDIITAYEVKEKRIILK